jgi:uncharacterized protein (DUF2062 family)
MVADRHRRPQGKGVRRLADCLYSIGVSDLDVEARRALAGGFALAVFVTAVPFLRFVFHTLITLVHELGHTFGLQHATAYVCENYACQLPTADPKKFAELLQ